MRPQTWPTTWPSTLSQQAAQVARRSRALLERAGLRGERGLWLLIGALWLLVVLGDLVPRTDVAVSVLYLVPIALTLWLPPSAGGRLGATQLVLLATLAGTALGAVYGAGPRYGPGPHPLGDLDQTALANRLVGTFAQVVAALIVIRQRHARAVEQALVAHLRQALQSSGEFVAVASHEMKTPLTGARGYAQLLLRRARRGQLAGLDSRSAEALRLIDELLGRLNLLTDDLLQVSRLQSGRFDIRAERVDLAEAARRVADELALQAPGHAVQVIAPDAVGAARADARRVEQVLTNLIGNALKYSPDGGLVEVTVTDASTYAAPGVVAGAARHAGMAPQMLVSVRDEGIGIPEAERDRLFQRFARASNASDAGISGTGLGLYLCRELIEAQGGQIWLARAETRPEHGRGTTVSFTLPRWQEAGASATPRLLPAAEGAAQALPAASATRR